MDAAKISGAHAGRKGKKGAKKQRKDKPTSRKSETDKDAKDKKDHADNESTSESLHEQWPGRIRMKSVVACDSQARILEAIEYDLQSLQKNIVQLLEVSVGVSKPPLTSRCSSHWQSMVPTTRPARKDCRGVKLRTSTDCSAISLKSKTG